MKFKVEKGIIPPGGIKEGFPFAEMEVGDSFEITEAVRQRCATGAWAFARSKSGIGTRWSVKKHGNGYRCWRIQ